MASRQWQNPPRLPTAYCPLPTAYCLLPTACSCHPLWVAADDAGEERLDGGRIGCEIARGDDRAENDEA